MELRAVDGGPNYYGQFTNFPNGPNYFPIGVWFESVTSQGDIDLDKDVGLNTYVVLVQNSSSRVDLIRSNGMKVIPQTGWRGDSRIGSETDGWGLGDELDMTQGPGGCTTLKNERDALPPDGRARYSNFGKGVIFWQSNSEAACFVNAVDLPSTDVYWFNDPDTCQASQGGTLLGLGRALTSAECYRASNYGAQTKRVRDLVSPQGSKPVWAFVEVGTPFSDRGNGITPAQIRAAVWHSIIAGARGIEYFNHSFGGSCQTQHALREPCYASQRAMVKSVNAQIQSIAPALNGPSLSTGFSTNSAVRAVARWDGSKLYVLAGSAANGGPFTGSFSIPCVGSATATVLGESRSIPVSSGGWSDSFADGNAVHIYRIDGGSTCGLS